MFHLRERAGVVVGNVDEAAEMAPILVRDCALVGWRVMMVTAKVGQLLLQRSDRMLKHTRSGADQVLQLVCTGADRVLYCLGAG